MLHNTQMDSSLGVAHRLTGTTTRKGTLVAITTNAADTASDYLAINLHILTADWTLGPCMLQHMCCSYKQNGRTSTYVLHTYACAHCSMSVQLDSQAAVLLQ